MLNLKHILSTAPCGHIGENVGEFNIGWCGQISETFDHFLPNLMCSKFQSYISLQKQIMAKKRLARAT